MYKQLYSVYSPLKTGSSKCGLFMHDIQYSDTGSKNDIFAVFLSIFVAHPCFYLIWMIMSFIFLVLGNFKGFSRIHMCPFLENTKIEDRISVIPFQGLSWIIGLFCLFHHFKSNSYERNSPITWMCSSRIWCNWVGYDLKHFMKKQKKTRLAKDSDD